jgi:O-antigen ligase
VISVAIIAAGWAFLAAAGRTARPWPQAMLLLASAGVYAGTHLVAGRRPGSIPAIVTGGVLVVIAANPAVASGGPLAPPLGYGNANAALLVQGTVAAAIGLHVTRRPVGRAAAGAALLVLAAATVPTRSTAGVALAAAVVVVAILSIWVVPVRAVVVGTAAVAALLFLATVALGASYSGRTDGAVGRAVDQTLTSRRAGLWSDAVSMAKDAPLRGAGPGRFADESPIARRDADARWAHSLLLQQAAETGLPGALLMLAVIGLAFGQLYHSAGPAAPRMLAAVGLGAFLVHGAIDYVAHFPAVPLTTAALVGAASAGAQGPATARRQRLLP